VPFTAGAPAAAAITACQKNTKPYEKTYASAQKAKHQAI